MTLGSQLQDQEVARRLAGERKTDFTSRHARIKLEAKRDAAKWFFEEVKLRVEEAAAGQLPLGSVRIPEQFREYKGGGYKLFDGCDEQLVAFGRWCTENGLNYDFGDEHDGVGRESWATIIVLPK